MERIQGGKNQVELEAEEKRVVKKTEKIIEDIAKEFKAKEKEIGAGILKGVEGLREIQQENSTLVQCPKCKKGNLRIMFSKKTRRSFVACSAYPECTNTYSLPPNSLIKKSDKICADCGFPKLLAIRKGRRPWEFCFNLDCESNRKMREEWERKKAEREAGTEKEVKQETESEVNEEG